MRIQNEFCSINDPDHPHRIHCGAWRRAGGPKTSIQTEYLMTLHAPLDPGKPAYLSDS
jgi:hypothetical protein